MIASLSAVSAGVFTISAGAVWFATPQLRACASVTWFTTRANVRTSGVGLYWYWSRRHLVRRLQNIPLLPPHTHAAPQPPAQSAVGGAAGACASATPETINPAIAHTKANPPHRTLLEHPHQPTRPSLRYKLREISSPLLLNLRPSSSFSPKPSSPDDAPAETLIVCSPGSVEVG